jgi:hypothetical protein
VGLAVQKPPCEEVLILSDSHAKVFRTRMGVARCCGW